MRFRHDASCEACEDIKKAIERLRKIETANFGFSEPDADQALYASQQEAKLAIADLLPLVAEPDGAGEREPRDRT